MNDIRRVLSYNDVSLVPRYSANKHLSDANLSIAYDNIPMPFTAIPIINSPMDKVCSPPLLHLLHDTFCMPITIHRFFKTPQEQLEFLELSNDWTDRRMVFLAVGTLQKWKDWIDYLINRWDSYTQFSFLVDVANGDTETCIETVKYIRGTVPECNIMAGNVATRSGVLRLEDAGANFIRCGIGGGSCCETRYRSSFGVPTLTTIMDCAKVRADNTYLIADGGIEHPGDIVKAIAAGADAVMIGKMLAATSLSAGQKYDARGNPVYPGTLDFANAAWVNYSGMASKEVQSKLAVNKTAISIEGVCDSVVEYKGETEEVVTEILGNLKSAVAYYGGCKDWYEFRKKVKFVEITQQGWGESLTRVKKLKDIR